MAGKIELGGSARSAPVGAAAVAEIDPAAPIVVTIHLKDPAAEQPGRAAPRSSRRSPRSRARSLRRVALPATRRPPKPRSGVRREHGLIVRKRRPRDRRIVVERARSRAWPRSSAPRSSSATTVGDASAPVPARSRSRGDRALDAGDPRPRRPAAGCTPPQPRGRQGPGLWPHEVAAPLRLPRGQDGAGETIAIIALGGGYLASDLAPGRGGERPAAAAGRRAFGRRRCEQLRRRDACRPGDRARHADRRRHPAGGPHRRLFRRQHHAGARRRDQPGGVRHRRRAAGALAELGRRRDASGADLPDATRRRSRRGAHPPHGGRRGRRRARDLRRVRRQRMSGSRARALTSSPAAAPRSRSADGAIAAETVWNEGAWARAGASARFSRCRPTSRGSRCRPRRTAAAPAAACPTSPDLRRAIPDTGSCLPATRPSRTAPALWRRSGRLWWRLPIVPAASR